MKDLKFLFVFLVFACQSNNSSSLRINTSARTDKVAEWLHEPFRTESYLPSHKQSAKNSIIEVLTDIGFPWMGLFDSEYPNSDFYIDEVEVIPSYSSSSSSRWSIFRDRSGNVQWAYKELDTSFYIQGFFVSKKNDLSKVFTYPEKKFNTPVEPKFKSYVVRLIFGSDFFYSLGKAYPDSVRRIIEDDTVRNKKGFRIDYTVPTEATIRHQKGFDYNLFQIDFLERFYNFCLEGKKKNPSFLKDFNCEKASAKNCKKCSNPFRYKNRSEIIEYVRKGPIRLDKSICTKSNHCDWATIGEITYNESSKDVLSEEGVYLAKSCQQFKRRSRNGLLFQFLISEQQYSRALGDGPYLYLKDPKNDCFYNVKARIEGAAADVLLDLYGVTEERVGECVKKTDPECVFKFADFGDLAEKKDRILNCNSSYWLSKQRLFSPQAEKLGIKLCPIWKKPI